MSSACRRRPALAAAAGWLLPLVLLSACSAGAPVRGATQAPLADPGPDPKVARAPQGAVQVPEHPAGFVLEDSRHFPDPADGSTWRYMADSHPDLRVDAYVYPGGIWPDDVRAGDDLLARMRKEVDAAVEGGLYTLVEEPRRFRNRVAAPSGPVAGRHLRMVVSKDGTEYISYAHLFYLPPYTVKVRSTFPAYGNTTYDARLKALVQDFVAGLRIDPAVRCRPVELHLGPPGKAGWVGKDGRDIVVAPGSGDDDLLALARVAGQRARDAGCPVAGAGAASDPPSLSHAPDPP